MIMTAEQRRILVYTGIAYWQLGTLTTAHFLYGLVWYLSFPIGSVYTNPVYP